MSEIRITPDLTQFHLRSIVDMSMPMQPAYCCPAYLVVMREFDNGQDGFSLWLSKN